MFSKSRLSIGFAAALCVAVFGLSGCGGDKKEAPKTEAQPPAQAAMVPPPAQAQGQAPEQSGSKQLPPQHPALDKRAENITLAQHATMKTQKQVRVSKEVKDKWKEVTLEVGDMSTKKATKATVKVGSSVKITGTPFVLTVENFVPDYVLSSDMKFIETRSNEPKNPAVLLSMTDGKNQVARGWVFKTLPSFNSFNHNKIVIVLVGPSVMASTDHPGAMPKHGGN